MKILVTGGHGYIGQNFIEKYKTDNIKFYVSEKERGDIIPAELIDDFLMFDGVVHLAALSGIEACDKYPKEAIRSNLFTAQNVFVGAAKANIPVVFTSSQAAKNPASSSYAMQKRAIELMAEQVNAQGGKVTVLRLTNVYGGKDYLTKKNTVIKQFITNYLNDKPIRIDGNGEQKRDFIHVEDVCTAIQYGLVEPYTKKPIDIGTGISTSINEIGMMVANAATKEYNFKHSSDRSVGVESNVADTTEAKKYWGFIAVSRMQEYINEMIKEN